MNKDSNHSLLHVVSKIELNIEYSVDKHKNESRINYGGNKMTRITDEYFLCHSTRCYTIKVLCNCYNLGEKK